MSWPIRGFLAAALVVLTSCGVTDDEIVQIKEGQTLGVPGRQLEYCTTLGCRFQDEACLEVFFEYGRSPALCLTLDVCERLQCAKQGNECAIFDGFPGQVKCMEPR
ncbi:hypothetical protein BO221_01095 [Archangium sp. Cb G35]|uniref:hypothetical protein n=1 Tax=Archangium sp. Cb G35 TaxID=1920190 RepID=UPI000936FDC4|nr:hypothetical protein [Archangium sp. Cb G35]OJT26668.1 hypothetical protein BO221_01095 [Archangium sp. Cb G35]